MKRNHLLRFLCLTVCPKLPFFVYYFVRVESVLHHGKKNWNRANKKQYRSILYIQHIPTKFEKAAK